MKDDFGAIFLPEFGLPLVVAFQELQSVDELRSCFRKRCRRNCIGLARILTWLTAVQLVVFVNFVAEVGFAMIASERADIGLAVALHKNFHRTNRRRTDPLEEDPLLALLECLKQARCAFLSSYFFYSQHESPSLMAPFSHSAKECF